MGFRLGGGHELLGVSGPENAIIPENLNQSMGLLPKVGVSQALERTGFFGTSFARLPFSGYP
jgi:hypothetical protein